MHRRSFIGTCAGSAVVYAGKTSHAANDTASAIELLFTGTGAADWPQKYPSPSESIGRGAYRGNASIVLDRRILVDCGATVPDALRYHDVDTSLLTDLFVTHSHGDHLKSESLAALSGDRNNAPTLNVMGHADALARVEMPKNMRSMALSPIVTVDASSYSVTALPANHVVGGSNEVPLHFLFEKNGKRVLYATDGAWLLKPTWLYLRDHPLDAVIFDATIGDITGDWRIFEHNSLAMIRVMCETLREQGVLKKDAKIVLTHLARTLWEPHDSASEKLGNEGMIMAWDGMTLEL